MTGFFAWRYWRLISMFTLRLFLFDWVGSAYWRSEGSFLWLLLSLLLFKAVSAPIQFLNWVVEPKDCHQWLELVLESAASSWIRRKSCRALVHLWSVFSPRYSQCRQRSIAAYRNRVVHTRHFLRRQSFLQYRDPIHTLTVTVAQSLIAVIMVWTLTQAKTGLTETDTLITKINRGVVCFFASYIPTAPDLVRNRSKLVCLVQSMLSSMRFSSSAW
jgi:hypothetical protein